MSDDKINSDEYEKFENSMMKLCGASNGLAERGVELYEPIVNSLLKRIADGESVDAELEEVLTYMLDFCFNDKMFLLYKKLLRGEINAYPEIVVYYVNSYRELYDSDEE